MNQIRSINSLWLGTAQGTAEHAIAAVDEDTVTGEVEVGHVIGIAPVARGTPVGAERTNAGVAATLTVASGGQKNTRDFSGVVEYTTCHRPGTYPTVFVGLCDYAIDINFFGY